MNRNQKIAIGCGAGGCLGLIVIAVVGGVIFLALRSRATITNRNSRINVNRSSSRNSNNTIDEDASTSSMSDDDKHKLFQAGAAAKDAELMHRVWKKLGIVDADGSPNDEYAQFVKDHIFWLLKNSDFINSINTEEKARAYVEAHIND